MQQTSWVEKVGKSFRVEKNSNVKVKVKVDSIISELTRKMCNDH